MSQACVSNRVNEACWKAAQTAEASNWEEAARSPSRVLYELTEHSEVTGVLHRYLVRKEELVGLEVGVGPLGTGFLAVHMAAYFGRIVGLEPLPVLDVDLADCALQRYVKAIQSRVEVVQARGEDVPFADETFDITCCINVVDHAQYPEAIVAEIKRVTREGGAFVFGVNTLSFLGRLKWRLLRWIEPDRLLFVAHPHIYGWGEVNRELHGHGWAKVWDNKPSLWHRMAGHGRMSFWILGKHVSGTSRH